MKKLFIIGTLLIGGAGGYALSQTDILTKANTKQAITADKAQEIALKTFNGNILEFEYDRDDALPHYELEIANDKEKVEISVDAKSGKATITEREAIAQTNVANEKATVKEKAEQLKEKIEKDQQAASAKDVAISSDKAKEIALKQAPGTVTELELEDGIYEVQIENGQYEYEIEINAQTGEILIFDKELEN